MKRNIIELNTKKTKNIMDIFMGFIAALPYDYAPQNWAMCDGSQIAVASNQALYSLIGNKFGGNSTAFNLPDLRGRAIIGAGAGPNLTPRLQGASGGYEQVTLTPATLPAHNHPVVVANPTGGLTGSVTASMNVNGANNGSGNASGAFLANGTGGGESIYSSTSDNTTLNTNAITVNNTLALNLAGAGFNTAQAGQGMPHENMMPYLAINYCIVTYGLYPTRP